jgi:hypothetical protein
MRALALVVGVAEYTCDNDAKLDNVRNDAEDFANKLLELKFEVEILINCETQEFDKKLREFSKKLKTERFDVGLFYFAGHGFQEENTNYLACTDTSFFDDCNIKYSSMCLDKVIDYMKGENPKVKILIIDACRSPFPNTTRGFLTTGLAPVSAPTGTIIAFSTSPRETAMDGGASNKRNSIYTHSLLKHINDPNIPIEEFFKRVRTSVYTLSKEKQTSWEHTSLIGSFSFNPREINDVSSDFPYTYAADENFQATKLEIDQIIMELKSYNWYEQNSAISKLKEIQLINTANKDSLFLLGRKILQSAESGAYDAEDILKDLDFWLSQYVEEKGEHILNGILFEIYFNSKGLLRTQNYKLKYIKKIFKLRANVRDTKSFDFISKQLSIQKYFLYPPKYEKSLPLEIQFEKFKDKTYKLASIKYETTELLKIDEVNSFNDKLDTLDDLELKGLLEEEDEDHDLPFSYGSIHCKSYRGFISDLYDTLCAPQNMLKLSSNIEQGWVVFPKPIRLYLPDSFNFPL